MSSFILSKSFIFSFNEIVLDLSHPDLTINSSIIQDRELLIQQLHDLIQQSLQDRYSLQSPPMLPQIREIFVSLRQDFFPYLAMDIEDCSQFFHEISQRCEEIWDDIADLPSLSFQDLLFLTRLKMFCRLVTNQYFFCDLSHRWHLCDEWIKSFHQLTNSAIGKIIIDDEFKPLLLPRRSDHNHLTRIPLLRQLSRLNDLILTHFQTRAEIFSSEGKSCEMYRVARTWIYRCIYQPHPPPGPPPSAPPKSKLLGSKKEKPTQPMKRATPSHPLLPPQSPPAVKVHCVCCSPEDLLMAGLDDGRVCCWAAGSRNIPLGFLQLTDRHPSCVNALTVIGCALFAGYESGDMAIWRLGSADDFEKTYLWAIQDFHTDGIRAFTSCLSPNFSLDSPFDTSRPSALLLSASADQHLCFWNATNCLQSLSSSSSSSSSPLLLLHSELEAMSINAIAVEWCREGHGDGVSAQPPGHWDRQKTSHWLRVFSASGSGSWDRIIRVFTSDEDGENIRQTGSLRGHEQPVDCLVVVKPYGCEEQNAEGKCRDTCRLVSCSNADGTVRLWDTKMNTQILCLSFLSSPIFTLLQSGDKLFGFSLESEDLFIFQLTSHLSESSSQTSHGIVGLKQQESLRDCCSGITSLAIQRGILYLGTLSGTVKELYL